MIAMKFEYMFFSVSIGLVIRTACKKHVIRHAQRSFGMSGLVKSAPVAGVQRLRASPVRCALAAFPGLPSRNSYAARNCCAVVDQWCADAARLELKGAVSPLLQSPSNYPSPSNRTDRRVNSTEIRYNDSPVGNVPKGRA
jgi:hypothetical protein